MKSTVVRHSTLPGDIFFMILKSGLTLLCVSGNLKTNKKKKKWFSRDSFLLSWCQQCLHHLCMSCGWWRCCATPKAYCNLPQASADGGPLLSPSLLSLSGHTGRAPLQPGASIGSANTGARLWFRGPGCLDEKQSCDFSLSWGASQGWKGRCYGLVPPAPAISEKHPS